MILSFGKHNFFGKHILKSEKEKKRTCYTNKLPRFIGWHRAITWKYFIRAGDAGDA